MRMFTFFAASSVVALSIFAVGRGDTKKTSPQTKATPDAHGDMGKHMDEMNEMMVKHLGKKDAEYDHRFIDTMIPHHEGAVMMAKDALKKSDNPEIRAMSEKMIADQEKEIEQLKKMQKDMHGAGDHKDGKAHDHK